MISPNPNQIKVVVKDFLADPDIADEANLNHLIDSLDLLDLILTIELEFGISIFSEEITPQNFRTLNSITSFISTKILEASTV